MPVLKNTDGVVVSVSDETAALLGSEWVSGEVEPKRSPGRPKKSDE
jgi:hypothetical protein